MERPLLRADLRKGVGKGISRKIRAKGLIPAIFYGPRTMPIPLAIDPKELNKTLQTEAGENVLIDLEIRDNGHSERRVVMVKDIQLDPIQDKPLHADFYEVSMDEMLTIEVPIRLLGKPEGSKMGGILEQIQREMEIQCLPGDIPKSIDIDVSNLKMGDAIHVRDIKIERGRVLSDPNLTVATVVPPVVEEKKVEEVKVEVTEGEEEKEEGKQ